MVVTVRCFGNLAVHGPSPPEMDLPEGARVADVLARLGLADGGAEVMAMLDNGPAGPDTPLRHGMRLDLLPIVEGG